jgi:hypothetical protein
MALYGYRTGWLKLHPFNRAKTKAQRTTEQATGVLQDSITIGSPISDKQYSFPVDRLEPLGSLLLATARASERFDSGDEDGYLSALGTLIEEFPKAMLNETFIEDLAELLGTIENPEAADRFAQRLGLSFVPGIITEAQRVISPTAKQPVRGEGFLGELAAGFKQPFVERRAGYWGFSVRTHQPV